MNNIKKISAILAVALGLSFVSAVSASATTPANQTVSLAVLYDDGHTPVVQSSADVKTANGVAGPANTVTLQVLSNQTKKTVVTVSGAGATIASSNGTSSGKVTITSGATSAFVSNDTPTVQLYTIVINTPNVGTIVANTYLETSSGIFSATADSSATITVNAAAKAGTFAPADSTALLNAGTDTTTATDATIAVSKNVGTQAGNIRLVLKDGVGSAYAGTDVYAQISGSGLIANGNTSGTSRLAAITLTNGVGYVGISPDGTAGTGTITVYVGNSVFATKTVAFSGTASKFEITKGWGIYRVGSNGTNGSSTTSGIAVKVTDANGNLVADGTTVYASSATTTVATISSTQTTVAGIAYFAVTGVAAGSSAITFTDNGNATTAVASATTSVTVGNSFASTLKLAFDKDTYAPGTEVKITLTALDASGNAISDTASVSASYVNLLDADITSSTQLGGISLAGSATPKFINGIATWTVYAPLYQGTFTVKAKSGTATGLATAAKGIELSATANISGSSDTSLALDAANAATDAANNAYEEAQNATQAASNALIAVQALAVQVKALIALVNKIKAKLKA